MAFDLGSIKPTRKDTPARILVYGPHKIGKSTFAAAAPGAIFIPTEDGQENLDAQAFPLCRAWADVLSCVTALYSEKHEHKTVVLDSADWAEQLAQAKVGDGKGVESIGYGKGYTFAADLFRELLDGLNALRTQRGMQIVLLCHAEIRRFDDPLADSYDRYQIKLHKLVGKMVQEWADVIGFAQIAQATKIEDQGFDKSRTRVVSLEQRVLHLACSPAFDAGNRYDLPAKLPLVWGEFETALTAARKR